MTSLLIGALRFYQTVISPGFSSGSCRFYPSCSQYAIDALQKYGALRGGLRAVRRVLRCHPFHPGGYDPA